MSTTYYGEFHDVSGSCLLIHIGCYFTFSPRRFLTYLALATLVTSTTSVINNRTHEMDKLTQAGKAVGLSGMCLDVF